MRQLDHLVMPVSDLAVARARLSALGLTVAAEGRHPFGTQNCCAYFSDGTFIEPLAVADHEAYAAAAEAGNFFVLGDRRYRARRGEEGLSAVVFRSDDAAEDHADFVSAGISAGDMLDFSRVFSFPDGATQIAGFRLAFAETGSLGDIFAFTCQRINSPTADRTELETHENGVLGIHSVILSSSASPAADAFFSAVTNPGRIRTNGEERHCCRADRVSVLTPRALIDSYGVDLCNEDGLVGGLVVFAVRSMSVLRAKLVRTVIDHDMNGAMLIVPPTAGQGVAFAFLEV